LDSYEWYNTASWPSEEEPVNKAFCLYKPERMLLMKVMSK